MTLQNDYWEFVVANCDQTRILAALIKLEITSPKQESPTKLGIIHLKIHMKLWISHQIFRFVKVIYWGQKWDAEDAGTTSLEMEI